MASSSHLLSLRCCHIVSHPGTDTGTPEHVGEHTGGHDSRLHFPDWVPVAPRREAPNSFTQKHGLFAEIQTVVLVVDGRPDAAGWVARVPLWSPEQGKGKGWNSWAKLVYEVLISLSWLYMSMDGARGHHT